MNRPAKQVGPATEPASTDRPLAAHAADRHNRIRVHGAREHNLKDVSIELPKRRLTVFTGVSGSEKSSLLFGTIAAESQRLINETYSAFVQGFLPTSARLDVDVLDGLTTAIVVGPGADDRQRPLHGRRSAGDPPDVGDRHAGARDRSLVGGVAEGEQAAIGSASTVSPRDSPGVARRVAPRHWVVAGLVRTLARWAGAGEGQAAATLNCPDLKSRL
jgi:hypothetical protein